MMVGNHVGGGADHSPQLALAGFAILRSRDEDISTELIRLKRLHAIVDNESLGIVGVLAVEFIVLVIGEAGVNTVLVEAAATVAAADNIFHTRRALARGGDLEKDSGGRGHGELERNHVCEWRLGKVVRGIKVIKACCDSENVACCLNDWNYTGDIAFFIMRNLRAKRFPRPSVCLCSVMDPAYSGL